MALERYDTKTVNNSLEFLSGYGLDHHSRGINHLIPNLADLPNFVTYIESRLLDTNVTVDILRGEMNPESNGIVPSTLEINTDITLPLLFNKKAKIEQEVIVKILDLPKIHDFEQEVSDKFFKVVARKPDFDLFTSTAVQKLINFKYKVIRRYTL
jgi:hypothetical protein